MKYNSRQFLTDTKNLYDKYHANFTELENEYHRLKNQLPTLERDTRLTIQAKKEAIQKQKRAINEVLYKIENNYNEYLKETDKVKNKADSVYHDYFNIDASKLDSQVVSSVLNNIYKKEELYQLAEKYNDNVGMLRFIGSYLKQKYSEDREAVQRGTVLENTTRENDITSSIDSFNMVALRGLGKGRETDTILNCKRGIDIANGFNNAIDGHYNGLLNKVPSISAEEKESTFTYTEE